MSVLFLCGLATNKDTNLTSAEGQLVGPQLFPDVQVFTVRVVTTW